ncbi:hypothetical protein NEDG_01111 [Nematocida displodere]|uniref:Uncharacterized protein n=1 Tax=Nematocida displodere TaxID=1805483 RepID=A0A177ECT2_9MICR|nr:hypothetical protein NEDG_01111 [Nematocida displodere]
MLERIRGISVSGSATREIRTWVEERLNEANLKSRQEIEQHLGHLVRLVGGGRMIKAGGVRTGGVFDALALKKVEVQVESVKRVVSTMASVTKEKKASVKGVLELPNLVEGLGVSVAKVEGTLTSVKGSLLIGRMKKMLSESPISYKWNLSTELSKDCQNISIFGSWPDFSALKRVTAGGEVALSGGQAHPSAKAEYRDQRSHTLSTLSLRLAKHSRLACFFQHLCPLLSLQAAAPERPETALFLDSRLEGSLGLGSGLGSGSGSGPIERHSLAATWTTAACTTLRVARDKFGVFGGLRVSLGQDKSPNLPHPRASILAQTPVFGVFYAPTSKWVDAIDVLWSYDSLKEAKGILSKLGGFSITMSAMH